MLRRCILIALLFPLAGCHASAKGNEADDEITRTVTAVLCAKSDEDRQAAVSSLASAVEAYKPHGEDDSASGLVDAVVDEVSASGCEQSKAN